MTYVATVSWIALAGALQIFPAQNSAMTPNTASIQREIFDPYFQKRAAALNVPASWRFEGTVLRSAGGAAPSIVYRASSPDNSLGVLFFPEFSWEASSDAKMAKLFTNSGGNEPPSARALDFLTKVIIPRYRSGAVVVLQDEPAAAISRFKERDREINDFLRRSAASSKIPGSRVSTTVGRVRLRLPFKGRSMEEWVSASVTEQVFPATPGMPEHSMVRAAVTSVHAPEGLLDRYEPLFGSMIRSLSIDPAWESAERAFAFRRAQIELARIQQQGEQFRQNLMAQHKAFMARQQAIFESSMASARKLSASGHQSAMETAEHMGDVQSMYNPSTGEIGQVSNQYAHRFADENGNVILTNSPTFDPASQLRGNWTRLEPIRPQ